ncbi:MAG TPA: alpha/beta fold hydrolase [Candidatus Eisenbacteria bacterium]|nr:alpha/beta fold hydrolase [Candidatus Eisenbacteria bacterium]
MKIEETWIQCEDVKLYGEVYVPKTIPAPAILICHGMNARGFHLLKIYSQLARTACENGYVALLFDFRGVGRSMGKYDYGFGEQEDVKCALNYLEGRPDVVRNKVFVVGHSLGGAVSLYALQGDKRVKGLVLWSVPKNHGYNVRKFIKNKEGKFRLQLFLALSRVDSVLRVGKLFNMEVYGIMLRPKFVREKLMELNECEAASNLKGIPLLIVNGRSDEIVGVDEAEAVYRSANEPKSLLIIESADHTFSRKEDELIEKTMDWIERLNADNTQEAF